MRTFPSVRQFANHVRYTIRPNYKSNEVRCQHREDVEYSSNGAHMSMPPLCAELDVGQGQRIYSYIAEVVLTLDCGNTVLAISSGMRNKLTNHPHARSLNDRSCQSATNVKMRTLERRTFRVPPSGM